MTYVLPIATAEEIADAATSLVETGHGKLPFKLDRRGLEHLDVSKHKHIGLALPPPEEFRGTDAAYLRLVFE